MCQKVGRLQYTADGEFSQLPCSGMVFTRCARCAANKRSCTFNPGVFLS